MRILKLVAVLSFAAMLPLMAEDTPTVAPGNVATLPATLPAPSPQLAVPAVATGVEPVKLATPVAGFSASGWKPVLRHGPSLPPDPWLPCGKLTCIQPDGYCGTPCY